MKKRILLLLLTVCMLVSLGMAAGATASAEEPELEDEIICEGDMIVKFNELVPGQYKMFLNNVDTGIYNFEMAVGGYTIQNSETGEYVCFDNGSIIMMNTDNPTVWAKDDAAFHCTVVKTTRYWFFGWRTNSNITKYYLNSSPDGTLTTSEIPSVTHFAYHYASDCHTFSYNYNDDGTHTCSCAICGYSYVESCCYGEDDHCIYCGSFDMTKAGIKDVQVFVDKVDVGSGWKWQGWRLVYVKGYTYYTANFSITAEGTTVAKVEYSTDGNNYTEGNAYTSENNINELWIRVTDGNGVVTNWYYYDGTVTQIVKEAPVVTTPEAQTELVYNEEAQDLVTAGETTGGTLKYAVAEAAPADDSGDWSEDVPQGTNAGTYTVWYKSFGNDDFLDSEAASVSVVIAKADAVIDTTGVAKEYTYTGSEQTVNSGATLNHSETALVYSDNTFTAVPEGGKQTVTISAAETANYKAASATVEITVAKMQVAEPSVTGTYTYNGSEQTVTVDGKEAYMTESGTVKATDAGEHTITYTLDNNHAWAEGSDGTVNWSIAKADQTIPAPAAEDANITATTVTLSAVSTGIAEIDNNINYGCSTEDNADTVENWQLSKDFTDLTSGTTYYFFASFEGSNNCYAGTSISTEITTKFSVTVTYSADGNAPTATPIAVASGTTITVDGKELTVGTTKCASVTVSATDGTFMHWKYSTDGGDTYKELTETTTVNGDMNIKAVYGYNVTVTQWTGGWTSQVQTTTRMFAKGTIITVDTHWPSNLWIGEAAYSTVHDLENDNDTEDDYRFSSWAYRTTSDNTVEGTPITNGTPITLDRELFISAEYYHLN